MAIMQTPAMEPKLFRVFRKVVPEQWERAWELFMHLHTAVLISLTDAYAKHEGIDAESRKHLLQDLLIGSVTSRIEQEVEERGGITLSPIDLQDRVLHEVGMSLGEFTRMQDDVHVSRFGETTAQLGQAIYPLLELDDAKDRLIRATRAVEYAFHELQSDIEQYLPRLEAELREQKEQREARVEEHMPPNDHLKEFKQALHRLELRRLDSAHPELRSTSVHRDSRWLA